jgi:hypothetical protein
VIPILFVGEVLAIGTAFSGNHIGQSAITFRKQRIAPGDRTQET